MTVFSEINPDALSVPISLAATGPRVGFLRGFQVAYETQTRNVAMFGIQNEMQNREDAQRQRLRDAGVENIPSISQQADDPLRIFTDWGQDYIDTAKFYEQGGDPVLAARLTEHDERIKQLKTEYPDLELETSAEMWNSVRAAAQRWENFAQDERQDLGGMIGSFVGSVIGGLNPNTDPLAVATAPLGFGKTIAQRIAVQAGAQGVIEGISQGFGVQTSRRLLGLSYGYGEGAMRAGFAAVGGAVGQGMVEGVSAGLRRVFTDPKAGVVREPSPPPVSPRHIMPEENLPLATWLARYPDEYKNYLMQRVSPFRSSPTTRARGLEDFDHVTAQLESWKGPRPANTVVVPPRPRTDTTPIRAATDFNIAPVINASEHVSVDAIARRIDPPTMKRYDTLANAKATLRTLLDAETTRSRTVSDRLDNLQQELWRLDAKAAEVGAMKAKKLRAKAMDLQKQIEAERARLRTAETPEASNLREQIAAIDEQMRDLAELVSRAYSRARNQWTATKAQRHDLIRMMSEARTRISDDVATDKMLDAEITVMNARTLSKSIPWLPDRLSGMPAKADAADIGAAVMKRQAEEQGELLDKFSDNAKQLMKYYEEWAALTPEQRAAKKAELEKAGELPPDKVQVDGFDEPLDINTRIAMDDGEGGTRTVTIREMLLEQVERQEDLNAVQSCSIR